MFRTLIHKWVRPCSTVIISVFQFSLYLLCGHSCIFEGDIILFVLFRVIFCAETSGQVVMFHVCLILDAWSGHVAIFMCHLIVRCRFQLCICFSDWRSLLSCLCGFTYCWVKHYSSQRQKLRVFSYFEAHFPASLVLSWIFVVYIGNWPFPYLHGFKLNWVKF